MDTNKVVLNDLEKELAIDLENSPEFLRVKKMFKKNALGFEVSITTLTTIIKKVTEQKFFTVAPADYLPVRVGEGAWSSNLVTYRSFQVGDDWATGIINLAGQNSRLGEVDAAIDAITVPIINWGKSIGWSLFDLQIAAKSGNWDLVSSKEKARKRNWDLGIQKLAFLGLDANHLGLLNQSVTSNTALITGKISTMTYDQLNTLLAGMLGAYRSNCNYTAWPTHLIIPELDYDGLMAPSSAQFPIKSKLQLIEEACQHITMNKGFKVLPLAYASQVNNALGVNRYVLLNYDEESLRMDIPVDYTSTLANSINNFQFQNVGYGQVTGVMAYRPLEMLYFDYSN